MRTIVDIPDQDIQELDAICGKEHISRAEAIRRAVGDYLKQRGQGDRDAAFGLWDHKQRDALSYQDSLRAEWSEPTVHEPPAP
ncbi:MAG: ribbon-helix-helix domain-containing protein [Mariprofundaceae bacterium]